MCVCLHVPVCITCMPSTNKGQRKVLDPLELVLHMVGSLRVGCWEPNLGLCKSSKHLKPLNHLSRPWFYLLV